MLRKVIPYGALLFGLLACLGWLSSCRSARTPAQLEKQITRAFRRTPGVFALAFKDLSGGQQLLIRETEEFHAASTMKTPVMIEVFRQAAGGKFGLHDSMEVKNKFYSIVDGSPYRLHATGDSEQGLYAEIGNHQTIDTIVFKMITMSSNLATNLLIEKVGALNVTRTMRDMGASAIQVRRGVEDSLAYALSLNNTTTAMDLLVIYEKLANGDVVDQTASRAMIDVLLHQKFNEIIPARLPRQVRVAHKTGSIQGVRHDSGIVLLPDGRRYVVVMLSKALSDEPAAIRIMAEVSRKIYRFVARSKR